MFPKLLEYYERELQHLRKMGGEFAREFRAIAGRLELDEFVCRDPYVERLLEGFAFLAARVQLQIDAEFPRFTQYLMEAVYPHYLPPTPSIAVVQLTPDTAQGSLLEGPVVARDSILRSVVDIDGQAAEFRTKHNVQLWPLQLVHAEYSTIASHGLETSGSQPEGNLLLRIRGQGVSLDQLPLDTLTLYLRGPDDIPMRIYESLCGHAISVYTRAAGSGSEWKKLVENSPIRGVGFDDEHESLLPYGPRSFQGYRLLQEYFAFPSRFMFVELRGLGPVVRSCPEHELDILILMDQGDARLHNQIRHSNFALFCTPAINLFPKRADRIHLSDRKMEFHVVPDRTQPLGFEVYQVTKVDGLGTANDREQPFWPLYSSGGAYGSNERPSGYYVVRREPRHLSEREKQSGPRSNYRGCEMFLSLVDTDAPPYSIRLQQLAIDTLCTNRDLPLLLGSFDFTLDSGEPVRSISCVTAPSPPRPSWAEGELAWRLISHLTLNYLSLINSDGGKGAEGLRSLLRLYSDSGDRRVRQQVDAVTSVSCQPIVDYLPSPGPPAIGRGLEVTLTCDEDGFRGTGCYLLACVLEHFFAKYVSVNAFTQTVLGTVQRGEIKRWPVRIGSRQTI